VNLRLSACVEMIFRERPFLERLDGVAAAGLPAFEFWGLAGKDVAAIQARQEALGLACAAFSGAGGVPLVDASLLPAFLIALQDALGVARRLACRTLIITTGNAIPELNRDEQHAAVVAALRAAAPRCEDAGVTLAVEPLNVLVDHRGYFLSTSAEGFAIIDEVGSPAVKLLYDIYHQQITEGNLIPTITANLAKIGHLHLADVPGRHEPGTGEINYRNVFRAIRAAGYTGFTGLEYRPAADAAVTLGVVRVMAEV
jgi:hydroxypyruvate isomerase